MEKNNSNNRVRALLKKRKQHKGWIALMLCILLLETAGFGMHSQIFYGETGNVTVSVRAPRGAFPEETTMTVTSVSQEEVMDALNEAARGAMVRNVQALDISFRDRDGNEIEPSLPISVKISRNGAAAAREQTTAAIPGENPESVILHVGIEGRARIVEDASVANNTAEFESDSFSTYIMADFITEEFLASDGNTYHITLTYGPEACIPEGAELVVREILPDGATADTTDSEYADYLAKTEQALEKNQKVTFARFFDITIVANGEEVQPAAPVSVKIEVAEQLPEEVTAVHFAHTTETAEATEAVLLDTDRTEAGSNENAVSFSADGFSVFGIIGTVIEKNVLASDGHNYHITVTCDVDSGIPEDADLAVEEILGVSEQYAEYVSKTENALGMEEGTAGYIRLFDISIVKNGQKIQPAKGSSVSVRIELADSTSEELSVVHFANANSAGDVVDSSTDGQVVEFEASGFSVYAIVDAPEPVITEGTKVQNLSELTQHYNYESGFYLSYGSTQYFINTLNSNSAFVETSNMAEASRWYFEAVEGSENTYVIYTFVNEEKQYMQNTSGNLMGLTTNRASAVSLEISQAADGKFYFKNAGQDKWLQHSNGGGGIRFFTDNKNAANSQISITYASSLDMDDDPYGLDGKTYGIAYHDDTAAAAAMMAEAKDGQHLVATDILMRPDVLANKGILLVSDHSDISEWTFHSEGENRYSVTTEVDGSTKYLTLNGQSLTLQDTKDATYSIFSLTPGTGANSGKWKFSVNGFSIEPNLNGNDASKGFWGTSNSSANWLNLVEKSVLNDDDFNLYTAKKVSVSDTENVIDGKQVVIYTRIWNDTAKKYEFYAVDHDGTLVRCYDTGDNIEWIGSQVNTALWEFTEYTNTDGTVNYYYELQNTQYGNYIAPQVSGGQTMSSSTIGINLNGRRYGEAYTTIIAWDDANYQYVGLKTENGRVVACPLSEAEDFYFAIMTTREAPAVTTVATVDSNAYGITMKMVDFNNPVVNDRDSYQTQIMGTTGGGKGLLTTDLSNNYPTVNSNNTSLSALFNGGTPANHLFLQSIYNESGYFEYDSTQNFAHLNEDGTFTVYDQIGAIVGKDEHKNTREHGQFMPYNDISGEKGYAVDSKGEVITNRTNVNATELSDLDARKDEPLYLIGDNTKGVKGEEGGVDYYFGMEMEASFTQTPSGLDAWGHDIIFEFSGDDDFWLYVDGELVIDLGGVHSAQTGSVNFRTGEIKSSNGNSTLYETFKSHYTARGMSQTAITEKLNELFEQKTVDGKSVYVFKDYSNHTMRMFYMERGAGASNLHMRFNLAAVKPGTFLLSKKLSGTELEDSSLIEFPYQIYYYKQEDGETTPHLLGAQSGEEDLVHYEDSPRTLNSAGMYRSSFTPAQGTVAYDHVFFLKPGETAEVTLPEGASSYYVVECGVNPDLYDKVSVNGTELTGVETGNIVSGTARKDFTTTKDTTENRSKVEYDNHVSDGAMRTLSITKKLFDVDGQTLLVYPDPETPFSFRLYLGDENASSDSLPLANMYPYYIKDASGNYCRWDADSQQFVSLGVTTYEALEQFFATNNWTDAQKESVIFKTSMNGSISKIPAGYTVEVRNLVISTQYKVEERDSEIPKGYTRRDADGYTRVDTDPDVTQSTPYTGTITKNEDPKIEVRNQKGWGLTVQKVWTDKDFMAFHDDIYFAVYLDKTAVGTDEDVLLIEKVYRMTTDETEIYYFFDDLKYNGNPYLFSNFILGEVNVTPPEGGSLMIGDDGKVTISEVVTVTPITDGGTLTIGGTPVGGNYRPDITYSVSYQIGESTGKNENIRTDTVTNSRPGIKLYKSDWSGAWNEGTLSGALAGAKFTLKDSTGNDVAATSYTSGSDGLITIAYLNAGTYTLTEIETPNGYVRLDSPITITVANDGTVSVSGVDGSYYSLDTTIDTTMAAVITIKNRTTELEVKKVDERTKAALGGVHFALYHEVTGNDGTPRKDYLPIAGYEDIVTDENGILPTVTMTTLEAGTYYLTETQTLDGYAILSEDICFTIGKDGTVTVNNAADTGSTVTRSEDPEAGKTTYVLSIPNYKMGMKLKKVDDQSRALTGAKFSLSKRNETSIWESVPEYSDIDMTTTSVTTLSDLADGWYRLTETTAPTGYVISEKAVFFKIENGAVRLTDESGEDLSQSAKASLSTETDQNKNTVYVITVINIPGVALPSTGGPGTRLFTILGSILILGAGVLLWRRRRLI